MKKQKWIVFTLLFLLLLSSVGLYQRWDAEVENTNYEMVIPYEELTPLFTDFSPDIVLDRLQGAGLTTVSINPLSLYEMSNKGIVSIYTDKMLFEMLQFTLDTFPDQESGYYITIPEMQYYKQVIEDTLDPETSHFANREFYFIPKQDSEKLYSFLGYDELIINEITNHGLTYMLRMTNPKDFNQDAMDALMNVHTGNTNILFHGKEVTGYPNIEQMKNWIDQLHEAGSDFYFIEFFNQHGLQTVARNTDYDIIRLHSINLDEKSMEENINQVVRAVKERNIRSIFIRLPFVESEEALEYAENFLAGVQSKMPGQFQLGEADPFKKVPVTAWQTIIVLLTGILFAYMASMELFKDRRLPILAGIMMTLLAAVYLLSERLVVLQGFALIIAVLTPIYAVLSIRNTEHQTMKEITFSYLKAVAISLIGIVIVVGLLNGNAFITGMEMFRGVKAVYVLPLVFVGLYLFWRSLFKHGLSLLNKEVKYWHLLLLAIAAGIGFYYMSRTGNSGTATQIELMIRNLLEEWLYVRPRTKEFLIGFPLFIVGLYIRTQYKNIGNLFLILGTIGFLSIVNTFTHFHIPLYVSLLRTVYSIVIGYVIGVGLIFLYKKASSVLAKYYLK